MNFTKEEREDYEDHLKWLRIEMNTLKKAENKSRVEGRAEFREEGGAELVKTMFKEKLTVDYIAKITGLTIEGIDKLIKNF